MTEETPNRKGGTDSTDQEVCASSYRTIAEPVHTELTEKKSRFLCTLIPVASELEIAEQLARLRKAHPDASHHCSAFRLHSGNERASDDGEPSGTAGRPMLHVLQRHELQGVLAVVTRYFGGTLLGAGGLVRAYTQAVVDAVQAAAITIYLPHVAYHFTIPYSEYDRAVHALSCSGWELTADFTDSVDLHLWVPKDQQQLAQHQIQALTRDSAACQPVASALRPTALATNLAPSDRD